MKNSSAYPRTVMFKLPTLFAALTAVMVCSASADPPWRRAERGTRSERPPVVVESWREVQQTVQRDFTEARDNVRRDLGWVRENAQREAERVRYEMEQRRARGFQFVHVLDAIFGRPGGVPRADANQGYNEPGYQPTQEPQQRFEEVQQDRTARQQPREIEPKREPGIARESRPAPQPETEAKPQQKAKITPAPRTAAVDKPKQKRAIQDQPATREKKSSDLAPPPLTKKDSVPTRDEAADLAVKRTSPSEKKSNPLTQAKDTYPYGLPVPGKDGMVYSPYVEENGKYVDVRNIPAGTLVKDPYSDKFFRVP
ncbi:MAG: hypothetical protein O3C21_06635 [Verrucomicrobia bacterium]|nr:hypothetical protein [Verrucomicrobiota bacterium]